MRGRDFEPFWSVISYMTLLVPAGWCAVAGAGLL